MEDTHNNGRIITLDGETYHWSDEQFEDYLATKEWSNEIKDHHRALFTGHITFDDGTICYE